MCGIVGGISERNVIPVIIEGLSRLEYRGYDSVGVAIINQEGQLVRNRVTGRVKELSQVCLSDTTFKGYLGIGHTRWATHGGVNVDNAHPHFSHDTFAVVHNGIIENYASLKTELIEYGYKFDSETDTEVIVHLVHYYYQELHNLLDAVKKSITRLHGAYAIGVIHKDKPNHIVCARLGSPLVIGVGINEMYFASDISALLPVTQKVVYLEDGDVCQLNLTDFIIYDKTNNVVNRKTNISQLNISQTELGQYKHFMQKEIFEQPQAIGETINSLGDSFDPSIFGNGALEVFKQITKVQIIACGTSLNAGHVAKYWIEEYANLECSIDIASEYRYRSVVANPNTLIVNISQSGETADTLASVKYAHELGMVNSLSICNVDESSLVRLSKLSVLTKAGPEIGVASTKAFTTQLVVLLYLTFTLAKAQNRLDSKQEKEIITEIRRLPSLVIDTLDLEQDILSLAKELEYKHHSLFLGRHTLYPIATEGSLKLKEISYIHAESYAAGELKHGPLALIDKEMPSIVLMPSQLLMDKTQSNIQEVLARKGIVYVFSDVNDDFTKSCHKSILMPTADVANYLLPILYTIPLQLLSYHTALIKGTDVDKPRNLAKSVTVE